MDEAPTLRRLQMIVTSYLAQQVEEREALMLVIEQLEKAGYGSIAEVVAEES